MMTSWLWSSPASYRSPRAAHRAAPNRRTSFVIAKYIEKYEAATEVLKDSEGQMMNETEYIDYTMNRKHGPMSASEAAASWQKMVCEPKKHYHDRKGIEGGYRFRVCLRDTVTFRNRFPKSKGVKSEGKAVKNPDAAGLQRLKGEVASGGQEDADEFEQMAKSLISSGGGVEEDGFESSFMGANLHNLLVLADDESEESYDQAPEVSEKDAKSMAGSSTSKGPLAKGSPGGSSSAPPQPVDERQVADECSKAQRLWRKGITSMADNFTELQSQAMEVLREAFPNRMNQHLRNAFGVCDLRSAFGKTCCWQSIRRAGDSHRGVQRSMLCTFSRLGLMQKRKGQEPSSSLNACMLLQGGGTESQPIHT